jgi:hypothetical protein
LGHKTEQLSTNFSVLAKRSESRSIGSSSERWRGYRVVNSGTGCTTMKGKFWVSSAGQIWLAGGERRKYAE